MEKVFRVRKNVARKAFNEGKMVYLLPCRVGFGNCWVSPWAIEDRADSFGDFDQQVNLYEYYNCQHGLGKYAAYYLEKD